jgi:hypothetical protein
MVKVSKRNWGHNLIPKSYHAEYPVVDSVSKRQISNLINKKVTWYSNIKNEINIRVGIAFGPYTAQAHEKEVVSDVEIES